jgi:hypothetical protein
VERLNKMARLHTYYISNGRNQLNYPKDDIDDDKFIEEVNRSIIEFDLEEENENENDLTEGELTEEIGNVEEYEEEEEIIEPGENDIAGEEEIFDKYFNVNNCDLRELLKVQVSVVIEQREVESAEIESEEEVDEEMVLNKYF